MVESVDGHPGGVPVPRPGQLEAVLERSRAVGFLGPGPVADHIEHADGFVQAVPPAATVIDLGAGGGLPGLVLAVRRPDLHLVLLDAGTRRCEFLRTALEELGLEHEVQVVHGRAEVVARTDPWAGSADVVVARSFGPPGATAECAVRFLRGPGSRVLVSEPAGGNADRWPPEGLDQLGLVRGDLYRSGAASIQELVVARVCPERFPRRDGVPARRPLF